MKGPVAVELWGRTIGAVSEASSGGYFNFQFDRDFAESGIQVAPLTMPLATRTYTFPELARRSFQGLPGLLADSLPDYFGNALINSWLVREGREPETFTPLERLCYVGTRGMGALEYNPSLGPEPGNARPIDVDALVSLASRILRERTELAVQVAPGEEEEVLLELLRVGTSAGGARAKALIAWNPSTNEIRSGQVNNLPGFDHWLLKFDGVSRPGESQLGDPSGYGAVEYAYSLMATAAGIRMAECRLFEENGRHHFMTRRFDRTSQGKKLHMLSLGGMAHYDFNQAGAYGYEQALQAIRRIGLSMNAVEEQYRRMVFNVLARNQDDHVKNIAFLMDRSGAWSLSPAFDVTYAFNASGAWTSQHQMSVNAKREGFYLSDFDAVGRVASMKRGRARSILHEVHAAVSRWREFAERAGVDERRAESVESALRLDLA
jgi:serine/threonine-protein kinase HipA